MIDKTWLDAVILNALKEDMPFGDITTDNVIEEGSYSKAVFVAKEPGVVAGLFAAERVFTLLDPGIKFTSKAKEGQAVERGTIIAEVEGSTKTLLKGERTALNILQRMCGIATMTRRLVDRVKDLGTRITDTRKTTPGLRMLEKYAVRAGGGHNHRYCLSDAVMLKDNHIAACGGIKQAVEKVRSAVPHTVTIEVEAETLQQVQEALDSGADIIMLDNMDIATMREAVELVNGRAITEASGNITLENVRETALTGVDIISSGAITHSVKSMDISLKFQC